jgi:hypothetical protein
VKPEYMATPSDRSNTGKVARRDVQCRFDFGDGLVPVEELDQRHGGHLHVRLVDDEVRGLVALLEDERRRPRVVGILGDEALAVLVDDEAGEQDLGRIGGRGDELLVEVLGDTARGDAHPDAKPVVERVAEDVRLDHPVVLGLSRFAEFGGVLGDHLRIHREAARGDHDGLGPDGAGLGEALPAHAHHRTVLDDEVGHARLVEDRDAELVGALDQEVDDHGRTPEFAGDRHGVAARGGRSLVAERPHLLVAGVGQALGARRDHDLAGVEAALELKPQVLQPVEVFDAAVGVGADLVELGLAGHGDEVVVHGVGAVVVAGGPLHLGATAEVEVSTGHGGRSACGGSTFEDEHACACGSCADRRAASGDAEPDDQDVDLVGPLRDV